ncbi:Gfo/Idh/MocA family protein [Puniceicoccus vermicola]|uniref:Gfo/Idh/MocA family oxidoreductase n=1 Tax=Puniceicoccus vermicola TaxID=388746 RepID=A0A7X1E3P2_9BACT|nr:Gfo/Idh/MocA family oxidoreductase [Puniceicoccus vermicola]MBC2601730.1 Gfo/Idh/MocA family oxidoreductase [Puniceicoccus vermicola]
MQSGRLRIGIIGLNFGRHILSDLDSGSASQHLSLGAVCDLDAAKVQQYSEQYSVKGYTDMDELLADPDIDVVGLYTGPKGRAGLLSHIIRSGKDVITTKPFELDPEATKAVLDEAKSIGRIIHLNSPTPKPNAFMEQIHAWEQKCNLGKLVYFGGEATASYREEADGSWLDDPERCPVAPIFRLGIYLINDMVRIAGGIESLQVLGTRVFTKRPTMDNANLSMTFENGAIGNIYASFCVKNGQHYGNSLILHYENGSIYRNCDIQDFGTAMQESHLRLVTVDADNQQTTHEWRQPGGSGQYAWSDFCEAVRTRDITSTPADAIVHGVQVIEAMIRAQNSSQVEKVKH